MKLFNAFPHAQQLKAPLQLSCKRHNDKFILCLIGISTLVSIVCIICEAMK